jgi:hypothetical protein
MQDEFRPAIEHALELCLSRFGGQLKTVVLGGSVAFDEALAGISDVDWFAFISDEPTDADMQWQAETKQLLERAYPVVSEFGFGVFSVDHLRKQDSWQFIIKYNSVKLYGVDIISELEAEGIETPPPTIDILKSRISWTESMWQYAVDGSIPEKLFKTPTNPFLTSRKIARYFILLEGAYLLMIDGGFTSFRQRDVLAGLRRLHPEWKAVYDLAERVSNAPLEACVPPKDTVTAIDPFIHWMTEYIRNA